MSIPVVNIYPVKRRDQVRAVGDRCEHAQSGWRGTVQRILPRTNSIDEVRVLWDDNGHSGIVLVTRLRRIDK